MGSTPVDPAFKTVPKNQACFLIWRIEKMQVVPVPKAQYGQFYTGDSYIILNVKDVKGSLQQDIHFWLGEQSSQDEEGVAAFKTVELDDYLGGAPVQHRECQGEESKEFLACFKKGIRYCKGGVASGFKHVEKKFEPTLLQIKGKRVPRIKEVDIAWESMNSGDVFILDTGLAIFLWCGKEANRSEKMKGSEVARELLNERGGTGKARLIFMDDGNEESDLDADEKKLFEDFMGPLSKKRVKSASAGGADESHDMATNKGQIKLYIAKEEGGSLKVSEKKTGPLVKADLDSNDSFIIDNGEAGIWVWNGKQASKKERSEAMRNAKGFITKKGYNSKTKVTCVSDGGEPTMFKVLFKSWPQPVVTGKAYNKSRVAKTVQTKFDASTLHTNPALAAETRMVDDGSGTVEVWRVENFDLVPLEKKYHGQFFGGDCYVILYTYLVNGKESRIIYYWQGLKSTTDEKGTSALKAVELDDKYGGEPVQIRVVQYKEPAHFMAMFGGKMIIFEGGKAGWDKPGSGDTGPGDRYLLQVRGTSALNTKAVQVPLRAASLNSNDVFVLFSKGASPTIWCGTGSTGDEREMAKLVAKLSPRDHNIIVEGQEKDEFWNSLGGKEAYSNDKRLQEDDSNHPPRLFQCSNASGNFRIEEIDDFTQQDLVTDDVMLLDIYDMVFIWVGEGANREEKKQGEISAVEYIKSDPSGRDADTPIVKVKQGFEPPNFQGFFGIWDRDLWSKGKTYEELKKEMGAANVGVTIVQKESLTNGTGAGFSSISKYPYSELTKKEGDGLPEEVDPSSKEVHLSEEEFKTVFGMSYSDFITKPTWKQREMKKAKNLF